jgi:hypothetical protein
MTSEHLWTSERTESISRRVFPQDRPGDCTVQPSTNRNVRFATQIWLKESQVPHALPNNLKNPSCSKSPFLVSSRNRCKFAGPEVCQGRLKKKLSLLKKGINRRKSFMTGMFRGAFKASLKLGAAQTLLARNRQVVLSSGDGFWAR